jgi:hypothetical protein
VAPIPELTVNAGWTAWLTPVDPVARGDHALLGELVGDEAVAELGVVVVDVDGSVDQVRVVPITLADRAGLPLVERLLEKPSMLGDLLHLSAQHRLGCRDDRLLLRYFCQTGHGDEPRGSVRTRHPRWTRSPR